MELPFTNRLATASDPNAPPQKLEQLIDDDRAVRMALARNPGVPTSILRWLITDVDREVRQTANQSGRTTLIVDRLVRAGSNQDLTGVVATNPALDPQTLWEIGHLGYWGQFLAARHPACPGELLEILARSKHWRVALEVAQNPQSAPVVLQRLARHHNWRVLAAVASHPLTSLATLVDLAQKGEPRISLALATRPSIPFELAVVLAHDTYSEVRRRLANNPGVDPMILKQLLTDSDLGVRWATATNPAIPLEQLRAQAQEDEVARFAFQASQPVNPRVVHWANSNNIILRQRAALDPGIPLELLAVLTSDPHPAVRQAAVSNPRNDPHQLEQILRHDQSSVHLTIRENPIFIAHRRAHQGEPSPVEEQR